MQNNLTVDPPKILSGRRIGNKSLKVMQYSDSEFKVFYKTYLLGIRLRNRVYTFDKKRDAEMFYDELAFKKFKGLIG